MLCLQFALFCVFFSSKQESLVRLGYHVTLFYLSLANHSAVSKPHPTEGAEIYAGCGILGGCKMCCAVCTPLCAGRCAACLCFSLFFCCRDFAFSNIHDIFFRNKQNAYEYIHPPHVPHMTRAYLAQEKSKRREVRCTLHAYCPTLFPFPEHVWRQFFHHLALSLTLTRTTTTTNSNYDIF